jgi:hypothetical protein
VIIDGKSPLLGKYARKLLSLHPAGPEVLRKMTAATKLSELSENWYYHESQATVANSWPQDEESADAYYDLYCHMLGITREQADRAEVAIASAKTLAELSGILELPVPALPGHIAVDGDAFTKGVPLQMQTDSHARRATNGIRPIKHHRDNQAKDEKGVVKTEAPSGSGARDKEQVKQQKTLAITKRENNATKEASDKTPGPAKQTRWRRKEQPHG